MLAAPGARLAPSMCAMALLSCSALLVVSWHGATEAHFHYFVMVGALALYEEWWAYLLAITFVVLQHGVISFWETDTVVPARPLVWVGRRSRPLRRRARGRQPDLLARERVRPAATANSEERFRRAFDAAPVAMALVSPTRHAAADQRRAARARRRPGRTSGTSPPPRPRRARGELAAGVRRARGRAALRARRRQPRLVHLAPLADPRRRRPPGPLHLPGRRHHRPQAGRRARSSTRPTTIR